MCNVMLHCVITRSEVRMFLAKTVMMISRHSREGGRERDRERERERERRERERERLGSTPKKEKQKLSSALEIPR